MATFSSSETRLRRYLRDPNADVWSQDALIQFFNEAQHKFNRDVGILQKTGVVYVPSQDDYTRCYLWEEDYVSGSIRRLGCYYDAEEYLCLYTWEVEQISGYDPQSQDGYRSCYSWEIYSVNNRVVEDIDVYKFPDDYDETVYMAYDRTRVFRISEEEIRSERLSYKTYSGKPRYYYRINKDEEREFVLYPRPSDPDLTDHTDYDDNVFLVYKPRTTEITAAGSTITNWLGWQIKYIERLTVSLALRINNDRFSIELADLWYKRYLDGLAVMRRYIGRRTAGRRPAIKTYRMPIRLKRRVDLPDTYPSAWK